MLSYSCMNSFLNPALCILWNFHFQRHNFLNSVNEFIKKWSLQYPRKCNREGKGSNIEEIPRDFSLLLRAVCWNIWSELNEVLNWSFDFDEVNGYTPLNICSHKLEREASKFLITNSRVESQECIKSKLILSLHSWLTDKSWDEYHQYLIFEFQSNFPLKNYRVFINHYIPLSSIHHRPKWCHHIAPV